MSTSCVCVLSSIKIVVLLSVVCGSMSVKDSSFRGVPGGEIRDGRVAISSRIVFTWSFSNHVFLPLTILKLGVLASNGGIHGSGFVMAILIFLALG